MTTLTSKVGRLRAGFMLGLMAFALSLATALPASAAARARVKVENGNLVTAEGERLRGAPFFMSVFNTRHMRDNEQTYRDYFRSVSRDYGMNCVRICPWIGVWEYDVKNNANHRNEFIYMIDKCVQWAEEDGIYAIVNLHNQYDTVLTRAKVDDFWSIFADRYKDKTHVIYEAVNEPNVASAKATMADIYADLRARAPNTHIILWSLAHPGGYGGTTFALSDLQAASTISYANASFGFHTYPYGTGDTSRWNTAKSYRDAGYGVINTEVQSFQNGNNIPVYYPYIVDQVKRARDASYDMSWILWAPRFNYASMDQYGTNHLTNADIGFFQIFKDKHLEQDVDFWGTGGVVGNKRVYDSASYPSLYLHASNSTAYSNVNCRVLDTTFSSQKWELVYVAGNTYRLRNHWSSRVLAAPSTSANATLQIQDLNTSWTSQRFIITSVSQDLYRIKNVWSGLYLTAGTASGSGLTQTPLDTTSKRQLFKLSSF